MSHNAHGHLGVAARRERRQLLARLRAIAVAEGDVKRALAALAAARRLAGLDAA